MDTGSSAHGAGSAASSSSSQSSNRWKYEVLLSFRGEDTRKTFTDHLFIALRNAGINTFMDNQLTRGENIQRELDREIEGSRIAVIVFSKRYAESRWCLRELSKIMMYLKDHEGKIVYPIFYDVDPSQVRKQSGSFWEAFQKHERDEDPNEVKQWRKDLEASADLSGWDLATTADRHEGLLIEKIVEDIKRLLKTIYLKQPNCLVGMDIRMKEFSIGYLDVGGLPDVQIIGIWGMGGIGKTTIARAIFNKYQHSFSGQCYLEEVRSKEKKMVSLQEQLLRDILKQPDIKVSSVAEGIKEIEKRLRSMKVLIVVDDIDDADQLDGLAIEHKSFGPGSRIIITTRDKQVLNIKKVDKRYKAQQMTNEEAFELLSWHAFGNPFPDEGYNELARDVVDYCGGLPLALKVVGRLLATEKRESIWESTLNKLRNIQENDLSYINLREVYYERVTYESGDDTDDEDYQTCPDDDTVDVADIVSEQAIIHLMSISIAGLELANVLVTSPPLHQSWDAVQKQKLNTAPDPNAQMDLYVTETKHSNTTIISFLTSPVTLHDQQAMVSSSTLKDAYFCSFFEFLCSKNTPSFSVNLLAMKFFELNFTNLDIWRKKLVESSKSSRIIITGHSFGGAVATLFTLWLLQSLDLWKANRPLCITFGSPLVGDEHFRQCVLQFSSWSSCFLNVASINDPVPKVFLTSQGSGYKPFGTFLLCSSSGGSCIEDADAILQLLVETSSQCVQNPVPGTQLFDYGKILKDLKTKALFRDVFELVEGDRVPLKAGIKTQLAAILGVLSSQSLQQQQPHIKFESLIKKMVNHERKLVIQKTKNYSSYMKLNGIKKYMANMEWYKKESKDMGIGYYDRYRNMRYPSDLHAEECKNKLSNYWHDTVTVAKSNPQKEGAAMRDGFLFSGTTYRRMIEPLHIAEYYRAGGKNYLGERPPHFVLLEQWYNEEEKKKEKREREEGEKKKKEKREREEGEKKKEKREREEGENPQLRSASKSNSKAKSVASSLNDDSCFWVDVEEALILCDELADNPDAKQKLIEFEHYMLDTLKNFAVTPDIFLPQSSFMRWWNKYEEIVGSSYSSELTDVMRRRTYLKYADGVSVLAVL